MNLTLPFAVEDVRRAIDITVVLLIVVSAILSIWLYEKFK